VRDDESELVTALQNRSEAAKAEAVRRNWSPVLNFFLNKADAHADDLRQETFERFLSNAHKFEGRSSLRVYILGIAKNVLFEYIRRKRRDQHEDLDNLSIADCGVGISSLLGHQADLHRVLHALRRVPILAQIMLELHYCERLTDREVGMMLEISPNTVRARLVRARTRLREELARAEQPDDVAVDGSSPAVLSATPADLLAWEARIRREVFVVGSGDGGQAPSDPVLDAERPE
jgi:RNA polymerase sigma factor (sigma-70 family)